MNNEQMPDNRLLDADGSGRVLPDGEPDKPIARMGYSGDVRAAAELIFDEAMVAVSFHDVDVAEEIIRDQRHRASQQAQARLNELTGQNERLKASMLGFSLNSQKASEKASSIRLDLIETRRNLQKWMSSAEQAQAKLSSLQVEVDRLREALEDTDCTRCDTVWKKEGPRYVCKRCQALTQG
jgi:chromosome segregation ATPase